MKARLLSAAAAALILALILAALPLTIPKLFGYQIYNVLTSSMTPALPPGSAIYVKACDAQDLEPGDIITFTLSSSTTLVETHRVVENDWQARQLVTKGDANNVVDRYDVDSRDLLGKVVWSSLILGKIVRLVSNPLIFVPIILVPLAIILITNLVKTVSYARKIAKDEEEAAVKEAIQYIREKNLREKGDTSEDSETSERKL